MKERSKWTESQMQPHIRNVRRIQSRIFRAQCQFKSTKKIRGLQKLLLHSDSARRMAVYIATKRNHGKMTAGTDNTIIITGEQREECVSWLKRVKINRYQALPIRRIYIPKKNGKKTPWNSDHQREMFTSTYQRMSGTEI